MFTSKNIPSKARTKVDRDFILSRISEEAILQRYLGITVQYSKAFKSPLRENDKRPSCSFRQTNAGIYLKDFNGEFYGDCFDIVKYKFNLNYNKALHLIAQDFALTQDTPITYDIHKKFITDLTTRKKVFSIKKRDWTLGDKDFWTQFYLTRKDLNKFNVVPIKVLWINEVIQYEYRPSDPAYAYYFGNGNYKIYFPYRNGDNAPRFLSNGPHMQGWNELELGINNEIIITKSLKDVIVLDKLGFSAFAPPSEGALLDSETIKILSNYELYILFDNDETGIKWAKRNSEHYKIPFFVLPGKEKDISDYLKAHGLSKTKQLIVQLLNIS